MEKIIFLHDWKIFWCFTLQGIISKSSGWIIRFVVKNYSDNHLRLWNTIWKKTPNL